MAFKNLKVLIPHTFSVYGELTAGTLPGFFVKVPSGSVATLKSMRYKLASGTSIDLTIQINGSDLTSPDYDAVACDSVAAGEVANDKALANNDKIDLKLESPTGTPSGLSCTVFVEYQF